MADPDVAGTHLGTRRPPGPPLRFRTRGALRRRLRRLAEGLPISWHGPVTDGELTAGRLEMTMGREKRAFSRQPFRVGNVLMRYALYRSYVLLANLPIEPISHPIRAWAALRKAQRIEEVTYESPALPLSYSATVAKVTEGGAP
jgi:hypothetical protein